jgi:hypothetical protein
VGDASVLADVVAANVARRRQVAGLVMRDVAAAGGCSVSLVHDAEHGRALNVTSLGKLATGLDCTIMQLMAMPQCRACRDLPWPGYTCNSCGASDA